MKAKTYDIVTQTMSDLLSDKGVFVLYWCFMSKEFASSDPLSDPHKCVAVPYVEYAAPAKTLYIEGKYYNINFKCACDDSRKHVYLLATHKWRCWE